MSNPRVKPRSASLTRARLATGLVFLAFGTVVGTWTSRIPSIKAVLGLGNAQLSIALIAFAAGSITGMVVLGRAIDRLGSGPVMTVLVAAQGALLVLPALAPAPWALSVALVALGSVQGTLNVAMNANAIEVQRAWGAPIMSSFHAVFSLGGFLGAAVGGALARFGVNALTTFAIVCSGSLLISLLVTRWRLRDTRDTKVEVDGSAAQNTIGVPVKQRLVLLLGLLAMFAMIAEGAAGDWSAVYLHTTLGTSTAFAAVAFVAFSIAMMLARLVGDRIVIRIGPVQLVRHSALFAAVIFGVFGLLIGTPTSAVIGFAGLGAGLAGLTPQIYSVAGQLTANGTGRRLSVIVGMGYTGFLIGPALIGFTSSLTGLRGALAIPTLLLLLVALAAGAMRTPEGVLVSHRGQGTTEPTSR